MSWAKGKRLQDGKYIIREILGRGAYGITYKAWHTNLDNYVVIKAPLEHYRDQPHYDEFVERFRKEGRILEILSQNSHPHIVKVKDLFVEERIPCLVMEFVKGMSLYDLVNHRSVLTENEIIPLIRQIADALGMMHNVDLVHRDVHPGNVMIRDDGRAMLIDFGIAKEAIASSQTIDFRAGNRIFAPYEQVIQGKWDVTVDIHSLAATLYYALTGEEPTSSYDRKFNKTRLIPPKELNSKISDHINRAIIKGMELEAKNRPRSMQEWLKLLESPDTKRQVQTLLTKIFTSLWRLLNEPESSNVTQSVVSSSEHSNYSSYTHRTFRQERIFPWNWLLLPLLGYVVTGLIFFNLTSRLNLTLPLLASTFAWISSLSWALAGTLADIQPHINWSISNKLLRTWNQVFSRLLIAIRNSALLIAWGGIVIPVAWSVSVLSRNQYWAVVLTSALLAIGIGIDINTYRLGLFIGAKLLTSFSRLETFLVLAGTSATGILLGWLVGAIF